MIVDNLCPILISLYQFRILLKNQLIPYSSPRSSLSDPKHPGDDDDDNSGNDPNDVVKKSPSNFRNQTRASQSGSIDKGSPEKEQGSMNTANDKNDQAMINLNHYPAASSESDSAKDQNSSFNAGETVETVNSEDEEEEEANFTEFEIEDDDENDDNEQDHGSSSSDPEDHEEVMSKN